MPWQLTLHRAARKELEEQPVDIRAQLDHIVTLIEAFGLNRVPAKYARHLRGPLWEFRLRGKDGIARASIRHGTRPAHHHREGVHEEDAKDTTPGNRHSPAARQGKPMTSKTATSTRHKERTVPYRKVRAKWFKDVAFIKARAELDDEFSLVAELIRARLKSGLTQAEVAKRMQSTQPAVARIESAGRVPSTRTLQRYARATGHRLRISLVPASKP